MEGEHGIIQEKTKVIEELKNNEGKLIKSQTENEGNFHIEENQILNENNNETETENKKDECATDSLQKTEIEDKGCECAVDSLQITETEDKRGVCAVDSLQITEIEDKRRECAVDSLEITEIRETQITDLCSHHQNEESQTKTLIPVHNTTIMWSLTLLTKSSEDFLKSILVLEKKHLDKHVGFEDHVESIPFDETKDFTFEIQIVKELPKKIVSYAALFAKEKAEEEERNRLAQEKLNERKNCNDQIKESNDSEGKREDILEEVKEEYQVENSEKERNENNPSTVDKKRLYGNCEENLIMSSSTETRDEELLNYSEKNKNNIDDILINPNTNKQLEFKIPRTTKGKDEKTNKDIKHEVIIKKEATQKEELLKFLKNEGINYNEIQKEKPFKSTTENQVDSNFCINEETMCIEKTEPNKEIRHGELKAKEICLLY